MSMGAEYRYSFRTGCDTFREFNYAPINIRMKIEDDEFCRNLNVFKSIFAASLLSYQLYNSF